MAVRKAVLGADYVARAEAHKTDFDADFQRYVTENAGERSGPGGESKEKRAIC